MMHPAILGRFALLPAAPVAARQVTLIDTVEVPAGRFEEALRWWDAARAILVRQAGYGSTRPRQAIAPDARFAPLNVAVRERPAAFAAATQRLHRGSGVPPPEGLRFSPGIYRVTGE